VNDPRLHVSASVRACGAVGSPMRTVINHVGRSRSRHAATVSTTLPRRPGSRLRANASRAEVNGKTSTSGGRRSPLGRACRPPRRARSPRWSTRSQFRGLLQRRSEQRSDCATGVRNDPRRLRLVFRRLSWAAGSAGHRRTRRATRVCPMTCLVVAIVLASRGRSRTGRSGSWSTTERLVARCSRSWLTGSRRDTVGARPAEAPSGCPVAQEHDAGAKGLALHQTQAQDLGRVREQPLAAPCDCRGATQRDTGLA
jgi:hypothetical protein